MSKAQRCHHINRLKNKRKHDYVNVGAYDYNNHKILHSKFFKIRLTTPKPCSCWLCGNPRKFYGNSQSAKTYQERKAINDEIYQKQHCQIPA